MRIWPLLALMIVPLVSCTEESSLAPDAASSAPSDSSGDATTDPADAGTSETAVTKYVAIPTFSVAGGTYSTPQTITISTATKDAAIYYTLDGNPPNRGSVRYTTPVTISTTATLKAIAIADGYEDSSVNTATYTIEKQVASAPLVSPSGGTFSAAQLVSISSMESNGKVFYTTNGTLPTTLNGTLYVAPFTIGTTQTVIAITTTPTKLDSPPVSASFIINVPMGQVAAPTFSPPPGEYSSDVPLTMVTTTGDTICYTTDGATPSCDPTQPATARCTGNSLRYVGQTPPIIIQGTTVKAIGCATGLANSAIATGTYTLRAAVPVLPTASGEVPYDTIITALTITPGANLLYTATTDGSTPADPLEATAGTCSPASDVTSIGSSQQPWLLTKHFDASATTQGLRRGINFKFRSCKVGYSLSAVASANYSVKLATPSVVTTAGSDCYAFGIVNDTMTPKFDQLQTPNSGVGAAYGALGAGTLCVTTDSSVPTCGSNKTTCALGSSYVSGTALPVLTNNTQPRAFSVVACKPGATDSAVLSGTWTFKLRLNAAADPLGIDIASGQTTLPTGTYTVRLKALKTDSLSSPGSAQAALGLGDNPSQIFFYYTTNGLDPVRPATCGDTPTSTTAMIPSGGTQDGDADIAISHTNAGTVLKVVACTGNPGHYLDSPITTLSWGPTGALTAPLVSPTHGTYTSALNTSNTYFRIVKASSNGGDSICFTQGGTIPTCGAASNPCGVGTAVVWPSSSNDIVFDGATTYTLDGNPGRTLPILDDNNKGNVHVVACKPGVPSSAAFQARYTFQVPDPAPPSTIKKGIQTTPSSVGTGVSWRFIAGAGTPTCSSQDWTTYNIPNDQALPLTISMIACKTLWDPSNVQAQTYTSFAP